MAAEHHDQLKADIGELLQIFRQQLHHRFPLELQGQRETAMAGQLQRIEAAPDRRQDHPPGFIRYSPQDTVGLKAVVAQGHVVTMPFQRGPGQVSDRRVSAEFD